ncbi:MAG: phosphoglycerate dehydrogenase [Bdellovibrionales bacterium]|nr:phosphoglycerate dehydrogenase [Bdellovibrionales bacterium]
MSAHIDQSPKNILLLEGIHSIAKEQLDRAGFNVDLISHALAEDELIEKIKDYDVVGIRSKTQITEKVVKSYPQLSAIGCFCIGTNQVDLKSTNLYGVPVFNAPYSNTRSVAELVIAECVALARKLGDINTNAHKGVWQKSAKGSFEIRGKTLGIVGYGHIGSQVSVLAESMGMNVIYYDIIKKLPLGNATPMNSFEELLRASDFVTFHVPATNETKDMVGKTQLDMMKKDSYLINASRGSVVVIEDLAQALKSEHIAGAAIDVFPKEPKSNQETFHSELQELSNVILTPHIGGSTEEAQRAIGEEVAESFIRFIQVGSTSGAVNFPNVELPRNDSARRIINVHKNVPGVLSQINGIVSKVGANIEGQYLSTDQNIGYLVMDIKGATANEVASQVGALDSSIKTRMVY